MPFNSWSELQFGEVAFTIILLRHNWADVGFLNPTK